MTKRLTPQEKWDRMLKPTTAKDYGIGMTRMELESIAEGRELLRVVDEYRQTCEEDRKRVRSMATSMRATISDVILSVLGR